MNLVEEIALFVEHLRDDYQSTAEPVAKVARLIREKFGSATVATEKQEDHGGPLCATCQGTGWCEGSPAFTCPECKGSGYDR